MKNKRRNSSRDSMLHWVTVPELSFFLTTKSNLNSLCFFPQPSSLKNISWNLTCKANKLLKCFLKGHYQVQSIFLNIHSSWSQNNLMFTTSSFLKCVLLLNKLFSLNDGSSVWEFPLTHGESRSFLFWIPLTKASAASAVAWKSKHLGQSPDGVLEAKLTPLPDTYFFLCPTRSSPN